MAASARPHRPRVAARAALCLMGLALACPAGAAAHAVPGAERLGEPALRELETKLLGASHAAEHAAQRRAARLPAPKRTARAPRARKAAAGTGTWEPPRPLVSKGRPDGIIGIHAALLPTGKVIWFSYPNGGSNEGVAVLWDPETQRFEDVPPPTDPKTGRPYNVFCTAQSLLSDGRLLLTGGNLAYPAKGPRVEGQPGSEYAGLDLVMTFDPFEWERSHDPAKAWQVHAKMRKGRWYPSQVLMPDGRTLILQGLDDSGVKRADESNENPDIEVWDPKRPNAVELLGTVPPKMMGAQYPHLFWMPSGRMLVSGPERSNSWTLEPPNLGAPVDMPGAAAQHAWGTSVLMPLDRDSRSGKVLLAGGAPDWNTAAPAAEVYDETSRAWSPANPLQVGRAHHNTVLLPDDSMVAVGGGSGEDKAWNGRGFYVAGEEHKAIEVYDPATQTWKLGPSQRENRAYHSTALLLPDGSVVSAGTDPPGDDDRDTYEIYKPDYGTGARPTTPVAPKRAGYGTTMTVRTPDADIARAVLVAPGATTHGVDMSQRVIRLGAVRPVAGGYAVDTPVRADVALPGHYMLFLLDREGRPSEAAWVRLDPGVTTDTRPDEAPAPAPAGTGTPSAPAPAAGTPSRPAPGAPGTPAGGRPATGVPAASGPLARVRLTAPRRAELARTGRLRLRVSLGEAGTVRVAMAVTSGTRRVKLVAMTRTARFARAGTRTVTFALSRTARARLRTRGPLRLEVALTARDRAGEVRRSRTVRGLR